MNRESPNQKIDTLRTRRSMIRADTSGGRLATLRRAVRHPSFGGAAALGFALSWSDPTLALGLGPVTQQSVLGQSLRVVVPVLVSPGEDIGAECFRLAASERDADGVPQLVFGRMSLERTADGARLVITNAAPVSEPVVRMTVQAGCDTAVRREYVLLMDPPQIEAPVVAAEAPPHAEAAPVSETPPAATPPRRARGGGRATTGSAASGTGEPARAARKPAPPPKPRTSAKAAPKRAARTAGDQPRLSVSSAAPAAAAPNASNAERERAQQELANALEAETVVLQRRIVELTTMVERMQQELREAEAAQRAAADVAAKAPAPPSPPTALAKASAWTDQNWPLLAAIAGLPLLLALGLLWRQRMQRQSMARSPTTQVVPFPTEPVTHVAPFPGTTTPAAAGAALQNTAAGVAPLAGTGVVAAAPKRAPKRAPVARDAASALAVSELSHVTEEARVYVALGHPERAIDVLSEHVHQVPRSMPAAWLMLLDLYRRGGRRQDFERLAEEFHAQRNVQAPLWENFASGSEYEEGGLETFPHIMREVTRLWRQPDCRDYLEKLLYDNRDGRRMGFPLAAYSEILLLLQVLDAPPLVDIDSDLVNDGKLDRAPKRSTASAPPASPTSGSARAPRTGATVTARSAAQRPLDLEPGGNDPEPGPAT
ncbi:MAG TPA: hypothetical protein VFJ68_06090 [Casimicrobiaceae bacterium]|nr:hypothetical protein [Casimicrobiaceae bacterium]